jgi:hypothetical protein
MELRSPQCPQCFQHVGFFNFFFGLEADLRMLIIRFIVMASSTEYSRKILNSPTHAEPCLVYSAKQVLLPDNW